MTTVHSSAADSPVRDETDTVASYPPVRALEIVLPGLVEPAGLQGTEERVHVAGGGQ